MSHPNKESVLITTIIPNFEINEWELYIEMIDDIQTEQSKEQYRETVAELAQLQGRVWQVSRFNWN